MTRTELEKMEINVNELLEKGYTKCAVAAISRKYNEMTMKGSNVKFRIFEGNADNTYKWMLEFEKPFSFSGNLYRKFHFASDLELGKFLFETGANGGYPKGSAK